MISEKKPMLKVVFFAVVSLKVGQTALIITQTHTIFHASQKGDGVAQLIERRDSRSKDPRLEPRLRQEHKKKLW